MIFNKEGDRLSYLYGLDLSMENTGVTIFNLESKQPIHISSIPTNKKHTHGKRLYIIGQELIKLKDKYPPSIIAIERGFSRFNTSTQVIYRVHGLVNYLFHDIEQVYYPPKKVKEAIIRGDAAKKLVRQVIENKYPDVKFDDEDQSDSFAIGICYLIENKLIEWNKKMKK
jgi:Holliday junction resolvasome RuvABC endonuclease subunit